MYNMGIAASGAEGSTIGSYAQFGFSPGRKYNIQLWFLTSAK